MASALNSQTNSYSLQFGFESSEAYSLNPTVTGSIGTGFAQTWSLTGNAPTYEPTVGPLGGAGSWRYKSGPTFGDSRFRNTTSALMQSINDKDFSVGFWVKINSLPALTNGAPLVAWQLASNNGFILNSYNDGGTLKFLYNSLGQTVLLPDALNVDQWYYFALTRSPFTTNLYVDGTFKHTFSVGGGSNNGSSLNFGQINQGFDSDINLSNWYLAPTSVIGATEIADIWNAGSTLPRTVKYYNGTAWLDSYGQKVWNGTAWVNWDAKYWNGTSWVTV